MEWSRLAARHTGPHCLLANLKRKLEKKQSSYKKKSKKGTGEETFFLGYFKVVICRGMRCLTWVQATAVPWMENSFGKLLPTTRSFEEQNEIGTSCANAKEHCQFDFAI